MLTSKKRKVLIYGFSVTAESPGYVGPLIKLLSDFDLVKVGNGGIQPHHALFYIVDEIKKHAPDELILEFSTAAFRSFYDKNEYKKILFFICSAAIKLGVRPHILDLPRSDVSYDNDWVLNFHRCLSQQYGIGWVDVCTESFRSGAISGYLRDGIHTNELGANYYSSVLSEYFLDSIATNASSLPVSPISNFGADMLDCARAVSLASLAENSSLEYFERSGFEGTFLPIDVGQEIRVSFSETLNVKGVSFLMGPLTSSFHLDFGGCTRSVNAYDRFCYYTRFSVQCFDNLSAASVIIRSDENRSDVVLLKGVEESPVKNYLGDILVLSNQYDEIKLPNDYLAA
ncbi:hypothetical protein M5M_02660 [Simiduia agarivorans SA1 = DSM 21679]|uniref:Uncharacterized protein n=2 Tax=Simiduia TaxID=447467 RepID=K4KFB2_SIMAS|nr:hypothetical protein M5M_02660 [Simiduia agarivorans SA1 = DSM 21679]